MENSKKKIIVTGSNRGIGYAIADRLLREKFSVIMVDYDSSIINTARNLNKIYNSVEGLQCDVSDFNACNDIFKDINKNGIYGIVNNAGINRDALFKNMDYNQWDSVIKTDLYSVFNITKIFVNGMIENNCGRIVNISSASWNGNIGQANYAAAKAGIIGFTRTLARELGKYNITTNAVIPGFIKTPMTDQLPDKIREKFIEKIPMKRIGLPEDVADAVSFLLNENSNYINGDLIEVGGGLVL